MPGFHFLFGGGGGSLPPESYIDPSELAAALTAYYTSIEVDAVLAAELANYYTSTEVDTLLSGISGGGLSDAAVKTRAFLRC